MHPGAGSAASLFLARNLLVSTRGGATSERTSVDRLAVPPGGEGTTPDDGRGSRGRRWRALAAGTVTLTPAAAAHLIPWDDAYMSDAASVLHPTPEATDQAFDVERAFAPPESSPFEATVPIPPGSEVPSVPEAPSPEQGKLAFAYGDSPGGCKVPSLVGLAGAPPYLHDGGVSAGRQADDQLGLPGAVHRGVATSPAESLRELVDRALRGKIVAANEAGGLSSVDVAGAGHECRVDAAAGPSRKQQDDPIRYLLSYQPPRG